MKLKELISQIVSPETRGSLEVDISTLVYDSRQSVPGCLFAAIDGTQQKGLEFAASAVEKGASALLVSEWSDCLVPQVRVDNVREALARLATYFFGNASSHFYLCGVTGTNGKTTITTLLESFWAEDFTPSCLGTITNRIAGQEIPATHTTPESVELQSLFALMKQAGTTHAVMEVSSHALDQGRVLGAAFDAAVFTNLTQDHLDYHPDMEHYFLSKSHLFTKFLKNSSKKNKLAVINTDDVWGERLAKTLKEEASYSVWTYGLSLGKDVYPTDYLCDVSGIKATIVYPSGSFKLESQLLGEHNLMNLMAALCVGLHSGLKPSLLEDQIKKFNQVPGRLERVPDPHGRHIFVDYAHTPDALKNVLQALKGLATQKIFTVFGCGGDRDKSKRPLMGYEAARLSDVCVVTSDNPRTENPEAIIQDILPGVTEAGCQPFASGHGYVVEPDRRSALKRVLELAEPRDIVLVAGKGHEDYQIVGKEKFPFSDQQILKEYLQK